jgi:TusA-related sulfurtransferase
MNDHYMVDIRNAMCPYPKYVMTRVLEKLREFKEGTVIDILIDCPSAVDEIPSIIDKEGYKNETTQISDGKWRIRMER